VSVRDVHVEYGQTLSDGNDGSERWAISFTAEVDEDEDEGTVVADLGARAKELVREQFKSSRSENILRLVETPEEREARWDRERDAARERAARPRPDPVLVDEEDDPERPF
jgi:hypothetical protein